jgi:two-component system cell cycle response regulator CtrA
MRVLVIGDGAKCVKLEKRLRAAGFTTEATDLVDAEQMAEFGSFECVVVDDMPREAVSYALKAARNSGAPVLALVSAKARRLDALKGGAAAVVSTDSDTAELAARIRVLARRANGLSGNRVEVAGLEIRLDDREARYAGQKLPLSGKEYRILELLTLKRGATVSKEAILDYLYQSAEEPEMKIVDVFMCKLRKRLKDATGRDHIDTVWGRGYRLVTEESVRAR